MRHHKQILIYTFTWVMMRQCKCIDCNKWTTLGGVDSKGVVPVSGQGVYRKSLYILLNFAVNLTLLWKKKIKLICLKIRKDLLVTKQTKEREIKRTEGKAESSVQLWSRALRRSSERLFRDRALQ